MTSAEMKRLNKSIGQKWFDKDTMEFWNTKIETPPDRFGFFITSDDNFDRTEKLFSIRLFTKKYTVDTVLFQKFPTLSQAQAWLRKFTTALKKETCFREKNVIDNMTAIDEASGYPEGIFKIYNEEEYILVNTNNYVRFIAG